MMTAFEHALSWLRPINIHLSDALDILIVAVLIYNVLTLIRGTRAYQMLIGISLMVAAYYAALWLHLTTVHWLLGHFFSYIVIIVIVLFQSEIRKAIASFGRNPFFAPVVRGTTERVVEEVVSACTTLASQRMGAIIAIERSVGLRNYIEGGVTLDSHVSYDLFLSIFNPASPLHDGAVIVQGNRIAAAACFLPLTLGHGLSKEFGTRHRAAIGLSEETDAVVLVVSEESGIISVVRGGEMTRNLATEALRQHLLAELKR